MTSLPIERLEQLSRRHAELDELLCTPAVLADHDKLVRLNRERSELGGIVTGFSDYLRVLADIEANTAALSDPELHALAQDELSGLAMRKQRLEHELEVLLLPRDPHEARNTILEIRGGEGGEEAALFAADLFRMYARYAETQHWTFEVLSSTASLMGGYKEIIALVSGKDVYAQLRFEAGVHRVQRVPATEAQGRIHTSTATVAVLPEAEDVEVHIDDKDLEISIAASGGPGGQGVNTTNSAVQIIHRPSGLIVKCQDERSQLKNKAKALKVLRARLLDIECAKRDAAEAEERRSMVSTGERSQKIRTYNYPQNRVTDHRIRLTLNKLDRIVAGELGEVITALRTHRQAELLRGAGLGASPDERGGGTGGDGG